MLVLLSINHVMVALLKSLLNGNYIPVKEITITIENKVEGYKKILKAKLKQPTVKLQQPLFIKPSPMY